MGEITSQNMYAAKDRVRNQVKNRLHKLEPDEKQNFDRRIRERLSAVLNNLEIDWVMGYYPIGKEIDLLDVLEDWTASGNGLLLPRTDLVAKSVKVHQVDSPRADCRPGAFGIPEPSETAPQINLADINLVIVPGVAFVPDGGRLGRGGGYYDHFLVQTPAYRLAVCYERQIEEVLPLGPLDEPVDTIITEERLIHCRARM